MKYIKHFFGLVLAISLLCLASVAPCAHEAPDMSGAGSIFVDMVYDGEAVPGGVLALYRVGEVTEDDENYSFALSGDFAGSGISLEGITSSELAETLAEYVSDNSLSGTAVEIGDDGVAAVGGLPLGLYLIVQTEAAAGYEAVEPFLVSIPVDEDGIYVYDVVATPKMSVLAETKSTLVSPVAPAGGTLPQTGQLNWPAPVMAALGILLFSIGWMLRFGKKEASDEV